MRVSVTSSKGGVISYSLVHNSQSGHTDAVNPPSFTPYSTEDEAAKDSEANYFAKLEALLIILKVSNLTDLMQASQFSEAACVEQSEETNNSPLVSQLMGDIVRQADLGPVSINLANHFADPDGDALVYSVVVTPPETNYFSAVVSGSTLQITPNAVSHGSGVILYATDGELTAEMYVPVRITLPPTPEDTGVFSDEFNDEFE